MSVGCIKAEYDAKELAQFEFLPSLPRWSCKLFTRCTSIHSRNTPALAEVQPRQQDIMNTIDILTAIRTPRQTQGFVHRQRGAFQILRALPRGAAARAAYLIDSLRQHQLRLVLRLAVHLCPSPCPTAPSSSPQRQHPVLPSTFFSLHGG